MVSSLILVLKGKNDILRYLQLNLFNIIFFYDII